MRTYKIIMFRGEFSTSSSDGKIIPFAPDNTDYQQFLKDWEAGAEVLNPDGTPAPYVSPEAK